MVIDPTKNDPDFILSKTEHKKYFAKFGHNPTPEQLRTFLEQEARQAKIEDAERTAIQNELKQAQRQREDERKKIVSERIAKRNQIPNNYQPPKSLTELLIRVSTGESYFVDAEVSFLTDDRSLILDFEGCNFSGATLTDIRLFKGSTFENVIAQGATFKDCLFYSGSKFAHSDLKNATIEDTLIERSVTLTGTSFEGVTFSKSCKIAFDQNLVLRANFKSVSSEWVKIYTAFTGVQQFTNIAFCLGYFLILFGKIFALSIFAEAQTRMRSDPMMKGFTEKALLLDSGTPVWQLVFGGATPTLLSISVAVLIFAYQVERYRLTNAIAPMIEDQKTDGITPKIENYQSLTERFNRNFYLGLLALIVFLIDLFYALFGVVYPPNPEFWQALLDQTVQTEAKEA